MKNNRKVLGTFFCVFMVLSFILSSCTLNSTLSPTSISPVVSSSTLPTVPSLTLFETPVLPTATFTPAGIGQTWTRPADGMVMVYVPEGNFIMGSSRADAAAAFHPVHTVSLDAYWIDRTEITNAMYMNCVSAGHCQWRVLNKSATRPSYYGNPQFSNYPVVFVNWMQAQAYCVWAGARLPTEAEWEKAARGTDGRIYPWGNAAPSKDLLNFNSIVRDTTAVGSYPSGASPYGALDMAGNVYQWVSDWYGDTYFANSPLSNPQGPATGLYKIMKGGGWDSDEVGTRSDFHLVYSNPHVALNDIGIRCARSAVISTPSVTPITSPSATPEHPTIADFFNRCPTAAEVADVNSRLKITFENDPTAGTLACTAAAGSVDLTDIQKKTYQTIIIMKYLQFDKPLPWTDQQLYDWFTITSGITGIRFIYTPYKHAYDPNNPPPLSFCCQPDHVIVINYSDISLLMADDVWTTGEMGGGLAGNTNLLLHEARHNTFGPHTCGRIDKTPDEMGPCGVEYYFYMWLAYHSDPAFLKGPPESPDMYRLSALYEANVIWNNSFCDEPTQTPGPLILSP